MPDTTRLVLASGSSSRRTLLKAAGLAFDVIPAKIDEAAIRETILEQTAGAEPADIASVLAAEKVRPDRHAGCNPARRAAVPRDAALALSKISAEGSARLSPEGQPVHVRPPRYHWRRASARR